MQLVKIT